MKREEKTELTKQKIIAAAIEEFGANGYSGAYLNRICSRGIPKGLLYHNFENKDAIYLASMKRCYDDLLQALKDAQIGDSLQEYMSVRLRFFEEYPFKSNIIFESMFQPPEALYTEIDMVRKEFNEFNKTFFERILDEVPLRKNVSRQDTVTYFEVMQSMFNIYFGSTFFRELSMSERAIKHEEYLPTLLDFMLYGVAERSNTL